MNDQPRSLRLDGVPTSADWGRPGVTMPKGAQLRRLRDRPDRFEPFHALRLIETWLPGAKLFNRARKSHVAQPIGPAEERGGRAEIPVDLIGLIGPSGTLPAPYLDQAIIEKRRRNHAFNAFFDLFSEKLIRLLGRASEKYHLAGQLSRASLSGQRASGRIVDFVYALCGFGTPELRARMSVPDEIVLYYAGLLTQRPPAMSNLQAMLSDFLAMPVTVEPFRTQWLELPAEQQTSLRGAKPALAVLGATAVSGSQIRECQSHFRIVLGPCGRRDFESFAAGSMRVRHIADLVTLFVGPDKSFDVQVILKRQDIPDCRVGGDAPVALGWNAWSAKLPLHHDPDEAVLSHATLTQHLHQSLPSTLSEKITNPESQENDR